MVVSRETTCRRNTKAGKYDCTTSSQVLLPSPLPVALFRQFRLGDETFVGPTINPGGVASDNIPPRVLQILETTPDDLTASKPKEFVVAVAVAKNYDYELKVRRNMALAAL